jgi:hypothetical protein
MRPAPRRPRRWGRADEMLAPRRVHEAGEGMPHLREEEGGQRGREGGEEGGGNSRGRKAERRRWRGCEPRVRATGGDWGKISCFANF